VCLALTCHSFYTFLEDAYLKRLYENFKYAYRWSKEECWKKTTMMQVFWRFLRLFAPDLPGHFPSRLPKLEPEQPEEYFSEWESETGKA
jgi:hypothetical protein